MRTKDEVTNDCVMMGLKGRNPSISCRREYLSIYLDRCAEDPSPSSRMDLDLGFLEPNH